MSEIWHNYDEDNSGQLDKIEAKKFTTHILKQIRGQKYNVSQGVLEAWFREFDEDGSGTISKTEMVNFIKKVGKFGKHPNLKLIIGDGEKVKVLKEFDRPSSAFLRKRQFENFPGFGRAKTPVPVRPIRN